MKNFNRTIIFLMLAAFLATAFTGIVRLPEIKRYFIFVYNYIPASKLAFIHDWSGVILVLLIIIHIIMKRKWFFRLFNKQSLNIKDEK